VTLAGRVLAVDMGMARAVNAFTRRTPGGLQVARTAAGGLAAAEVVLMGVLAARGHRRVALRMLFTVGAIYVASDLLGGLVARQRPFARLDEVHELLSHHPARSFPSRHVASAVAMAYLALPADRRVAGLMASFAALLGLSRVASGLHYPSDVLGGLLLGLAVARANQRLQVGRTSRPSS
jgi:undecaprenyl-diphosphatase